MLLNRAVLPPGVTRPASPSDKKSALMPHSALPLYEVFEQVFPLILARGQTYLSCASLDLCLLALLRAFVGML